MFKSDPHVVRSMSVSKIFISQRYSYRLIKFRNFKSVLSVYWTLKFVCFFFFLSLSYDTVKISYDAEHSNKRVRCPFNEIFFITVIFVVDELRVGSLFNEYFSIVRISYYFFFLLTFFVCVFRVTRASDARTRNNWSEAKQQQQQRENNPNLFYCTAVFFFSPTNAKACAALY